MPLCFAYGANLDAAAMAGRCPGARLVGRARLARHRFFVMDSGWASVARDPTRAVHGLVWDVPLADMPALDAFEEVQSGLYVKALQSVILEAGGTRRALVYIGASTRTGRPRPGYLEGVVAAAEAAGLPAAWLRELTGHLPAGRARAAAPSLAPAPDPASPAGATTRVRPRFATPVDPARKAPR